MQADAWGGLAIILLGVLAICQVVRGNALKRIGAPS